MKNLFQKLPKSGPPRRRGIARGPLRETREPLRETRGCTWIVTTPLMLYELCHIGRWCKLGASNHAQSDASAFCLAIPLLSAAHIPLVSFKGPLVSP